PDRPDVLGRTHRGPAEAGGDPAPLATRPPGHPTARTCHHVPPGSHGTQGGRPSWCDGADRYGAQLFPPSRPLLIRRITRRARHRATVHRLATVRPRRHVSVHWCIARVRQRSRTVHLRGTPTSRNAG